MRSFIFNLAFRFLQDQGNTRKLVLFRVISGNIHQIRLGKWMCIGKVHSMLCENLLIVQNSANEQIRQFTDIFMEIAA